MALFRRKKSSAAAPTAEELVRGHFHPLGPEQLVTASRTFPVTARVDLQAALDKVFTERLPASPVGVHVQFHHETLTIAHFFHAEHYRVLVGPLQFDEVDIGETLPARCLKQALWLARTPAGPIAVLLSAASQFGRSLGLHLEVAVLPGEAGADASRRFLDEVEQLVRTAGSYRGKVLSLEAMDDYSGRAAGVKVHKLHAVARDEVILPRRTLELLERNVFEFIEHRRRLRDLGLPVKKGLLFYGPPGTGKTHTLHYLAGQLPEHTTLLITAEQVGYLDVYFQLARFLQPAMVVVEDVDLIARAREEMRGACEEALLNKLLNEMDGLREDAELLFVLTTNRPDQLEAALASRPGRIDQAIEFPLPDDQGRRRLARLYAAGLELPDDVLEDVVGRTRNASAAFIKELMRRSAQFSLQDGGGPLTAAHVTGALEEMLFSGGSLNVRLLGGAADSGSIN